jgi:4-methyl-5(b-hydroxyethyl)-thiazole monophosphate biosynthesis
MKKTALVVLTDGFEEIEAVCPIDLLRRAEVEVVVASRTGSLNVRGRSGVTFVADSLLEGVGERVFDLIVLPGGPGTDSLRGDERVLALVKAQVDAGRMVGAICAAPTVLLDAGVLRARRVTAHFSVADELPGLLEKERVVVDGAIITSRGAGTSIPFALALVEKLCGYNKALQIAHAICTEV